MAEVVLGARVGSSPRSQVWEATLDGEPVIVKRVSDAGAFARELAALEFAAGSGVVPRVVTADPERRELVLEYLPHEPPPPGWRVAWATALAALHTSPVAARPDAVPAWEGPSEADGRAFLGLAQALGANVRAAAVFSLLERLPHSAGPAVLLHGDPCPANDRHTPAGVRFVDLEQASVGPALVELAYLRIGFPTCWCVTRATPAELGAAEAAYASHSGIEVEPGITDACASWLIRGDALVERAHRDGTDHLARVLHEDWTWGTATARERLVHRLQVVAGLGHELSDPAAAMAVAARERWPGLRVMPGVRGAV